MGLYTSWRSYYHSTDFDTYYYAAKDVLSGSSVYSDHEDVSPYIYPPFFACLITPLGFFSLPVASFMWYLLNVVFFLFTLLISYGLIFERKSIYAVQGSILFLPKALFVILVSVFFLDNISMLQVNIFVLFLILLGLYNFKKNRDISAGLLLGAAISVKVIPILFLAYFVVKRELRTAVSIFLGTLVFCFGVPLLFMGPEGAWRSFLMWNDSMFLRSVTFVPNPDMIITMFNPQNQSVTALFSRILIRNDFTILHFKRMAHEYYPFLINWTFALTREQALCISKIFTFCLAFLTFIYCLRRISDRKAYSLNYEFALIFLISLIMNPILKTQQMAFLLFPLFFLISEISRAACSKKYLYFSFMVFALLFLSQISVVFKILSFGALSILSLWLVILLCYHRSLLARHI